MNFIQKYQRALICLTAAIITLAATVPLIGAGLPYFYEEDEGHHYNRTVEMAKTGDLNPHYFHKPSLHFYLRLPAVYLAYEVLKWRGEISSMQEIKTRDRYGLADYSFTASHVLIAKACRLVSVLLTVGVICFTVLICFEIRIGALWALVSGIIVIVSPEVLKNSTIIGVDVLMAFMVVSATYFALIYIKTESLKTLILAALLSGLAVSSKYNAAPIACLPFLAVLISKKRSLKHFIFAALLPLLGFIIGSPYFFLSLDLVKKHVGYEYEHYRVLGHEGHSAEPGLDQALFYTKWLLGDGVGIAAAILALVGLILLILSRKKEAIIFLAYPVLYMGLMIAQKTNFTRNMVVMVPFVSILAVFSLSYLSTVLRRSKLTEIVFALPILGLLVYSPILKSFALTNSLMHRHETRNSISPLLDKYLAAQKNIFVGGELWLPNSLYTRPGVKVGDSLKANFVELAQNGIDVFVVPGYRRFSAEESEILNFDNLIAGDSEPQRIVNNPTINIFSVKLDKLIPLLDQSKSLPEVTLQVNHEKEQPELCGSSAEPHCWLSDRVNIVQLKIPNTSQCSQRCYLSLDVMSPWEQRKVHMTLGALEKTFELDNSQVGSWQKLKIELPGWPIEDRLDLKVYLERVASPSIWHISPDERLLGLALKNATIQDH